MGPPRKVVVGLAAEAAAQAAAREGAASADGSANGAGSSRGRASTNGWGRRAPDTPTLPPAPAAPAAGHQGTCPCGLPASTSCTGGCGRPICGEHLLNRASRLAWPGPYRSEREHTAYLQAFWASVAPLCTWCREAAGVAALAALPPVPPLAGGVLERLTVLLRHPHDYPAGSWEQTVREQGGAAVVLRLLGPGLQRRGSPREFEGRKKGDVLRGVLVGGAGTPGPYEVVDAGGSLWSVRDLGSGVVRKRRAWAWERAGEDRVAELLPRIVELGDHRR